MATFAYTVTSEKAVIYAGLDNEEMWVLLHQDSTPAEHAEIMDMLDRFGLETLDESETPAEIISGGWTKIWCAEVELMPEAYACRCGGDQEHPRSQSCSA